MEIEKFYTGWREGSVLMIHSRVVIVQSNTGDTIRFTDGTHVPRTDLERYLASGSAECKVSA